MQDTIRQALRDGAIDTALGQARDWASRSPQDAQAQRWLAIALRQAGQTDEARKVIERAISLAPEDSDLHFTHAGLLLGAQQVDAATEALDRSVEFNPNQLGAYIMQAHLALARGEGDEAARLVRLGERIEEDHPQLVAVKGLLALRTGDADEALKLLSQASQQAPDDARILHGLGMAYQAKGHLAFAEQAFAKLLAQHPKLVPLRLQLARLQHAQDRPDDALEQVRGMLAEAPDAPGLLRIAGELALQLGRDQEAIDWLRKAVQAMPGEPRALEAALQGWWRLRDFDDARSVLDALIDAHPQQPTLWRARMQLAEMAGEDDDDVLQLWLAEVPDSVAALEMRMALQGRDGMRAEADATARSILELQPGHGPANLQLVAGLVADDPSAAVARLDELLEQAQGEDNRTLLQDWRASALEAAGRHGEAVQTWLQLQAAVAPHRAPLPALTAAPVQWPAAADSGAGNGVAFVFGLPGSGLERVVPALGRWFGAWRADRFGANPPNDAFQYLDSAGRIAAGDLSADTCMRAWEAAMPARGIQAAAIIDWLPWWDNALLQVLRPNLPAARLLYALRDPRDMLLQWLRGNIIGVPFAIDSIDAAARWLADALHHVVALRDGKLLDLQLMRLDENSDTLARDVLAKALSLDLSEAPSVTTVTSSQPAGHWRHYSEVLAGPFAILQEVAVELDYPAR
ncbi:MAG: tetratricopeptide repeat protein [Pseudoxanthomonas suwonensis]|nr:tetratricopeptide repeat protein [Pseudoxanthomonas suwonensis]